MKNVRRAVGALSSVGLLGVTLMFVAGTGTVATAAPAIVSAPRVPGPGNGNGLHGTWGASNWSGYAETGTFTGVSGTWTVPTVTGSTSSQYSAAWVGVDGFNNSNLIQTGTEQDWYSGSAHYGAWWEILPAPETALPSNYTVKAGDSMSAQIYETSTLSGSAATHGRGRGGFGGGGGGSQHVWSITISDATQNWTFTTTPSYSGPGTSAEWIMEATSVGGKISTLPHYTFAPKTLGAGDFDNAGIQTSLVGSPTYTPAELNYANDSGVMIQNNAVVSTPGDPGATNNVAFNVAYGSALPSTPTS